MDTILVQDGKAVQVWRGSAPTAAVDGTLVQAEPGRVCAGMLFDGANFSIPPIEITPADVKKEQARRIWAAFPQAKQNKIILEGGASLEAMKAEIDRIGLCARRLEGLYPIPSDFKHDRWWSAGGAVPVPEVSPLLQAAAPTPPASQPLAITLNIAGQPGGQVITGVAGAEPQQTLPNTVPATPMPSPAQSGMGVADAMAAIEKVQQELTASIWPRAKEIAAETATRADAGLRSGKPDPAQAQAIEAINRHASAAGLMAEEYVSKIIAERFAAHDMINTISAAVGVAKSDIASASDPAAAYRAALARLRAIAGV